MRLRPGVKRATTVAINEQNTSRDEQKSQYRPNNHKAKIDISKLKKMQKKEFCWGKQKNVDKSKLTIQPKLT